MKKILALTLVLALLLCGCGASEPVSGEVTPQTQAAEEPQLEEKELSVGRMEGGVYTNSYFGIGCELDSDWTFYSAEELQALPGDMQTLMEGTEVGDLLSDLQQFFDMKAENVNDLLTVNLVYSKLSIQERLAYATMDEEEIVDITLEQSEQIKEGLTAAGMEVESLEKVKVTFLGQEHYAVRIVAQSGEIPIYMLQVMNYHLGEYGVNLTATSYMGDNTQSVLDMFYAVE